jgi:ParB family chromosome partitioning protein
MSIKDRLTKKTEGLFFPPKNESSASPSAVPLRTGPGQMLMVNSLMKESNEKLAVLEARLKQFEGALPVRLIKADQIVASRWANRVDESFVSADFQSLKEEIAQAQGNVQPIKVRPVSATDEGYEIVFGHRRHQACKELGLPVLALVDTVNDQELFKEMDRENRTRADLSPWEQGRMYRRALDEGLFSTLGELSKEIGVDKGNLSKALRLAELPDAVVQAFRSPLDLQFRWAKLLSDAIEQDESGVLARARAISAEPAKSRVAKDVLEKLLGSMRTEATAQAIMIRGKEVAIIARDGDKLLIQFPKGTLSDERTQELKRVIAEFLQR